MGKKKIFSELKFSDAFMFAAAMEDEELCRLVLERILEMPIKRVRVRPEAALLVNSDYRSVRLDVYADDGKGTVYDVEMQTTDKHNLPKRSRAYQGQMDMAALMPGEDFNALPQSFIIFICTYDPFGGGRYRYTCETVCRETGEALGDGAHRIFLNTKGRNAAEEPSELVRFLQYVEGSLGEGYGGDDPLIRRIETKITNIKRDRSMEVRYMLFSEMLSDERMEGRKEERSRLFHLMDLMEAGGEADKIPQLRRDPEFLQKMYHKYHMEV